MLIELREGMTLHPCTFNAVIAPGKVMISALPSSMDLQRFVVHTEPVRCQDRIETVPGADVDI